MTLSELYSTFRAGYMLPRLKPTTINGYDNNFLLHILPAFGDRDIITITFDDLDKLVSLLSDKGLSNTTIVYALATLRKAYSFALKRNYCSTTPFIGFDLPRKARYNYHVLTYSQLTMLISSTKDTDFGLAYLLASHYGLRRGEVLGLRTSDLSGRLLSVSRTRSIVHGTDTVTTPKNGRFRIVKLLPSDVSSILEYDAARTSGEYLLRSSSGVALSPAMLDKHFRQSLLALGLPRVRFHDLRHSYATYMLSKGVNPKIVSDVLGHSSVDITLDLYSHCMTDFQDACLKNL